MREAFYILFFLCSVLAFGQNNSSLESRSVAIKNNFSTEEVFAYQESANLKLKDFYSYLTLYSNTNLSSALKTEIENNIYRLTGNEHFYLLDIFSKGNSSISITDFLLKIENQNYKFSISNIINSNAEFQSWNCSYELKVLFKNDFLIKNINQKIVFSPIEKSFGNNKKIVWNIYLGDFIN